MDLPPTLLTNLLDMLTPPLPPGHLWQPLGPGLHVQGVSDRALLRLPLRRGARCGLLPGEGRQGAGGKVWGRRVGEGGCGSNPGPTPASLTLNPPSAPPGRLLDVDGKSPDGQAPPAVPRGGTPAGRRVL